MNNKLYKIFGTIVVALALIAIGWFAHSNHTSVPTHLGSIAGTGEPSGFDNVSLTGGLKVGVAGGDVSLPTYGVGSLQTTGVIVSSSTIYAQLGSVSGGLCTLSQSSSTLTPNTLYLVAANLTGCSLLSVTNGSSTGALTLVMPASSTMTSFQYIGDSSQMYIYAASTTAGGVILTGTSTAGFSVASTSALLGTISAGGTGLFDILRLPTTNLIGTVTSTK